MTMGDQLDGHLLISALVYYFLSLTLSVCLFVTNIDSSFVCRWNQAIFGHQFIHDKNYKTVFFDF